METQELVAIYTLTGTIVVSTTAILIAVWKTWSQASETNDAVNKKHKDHPRLFDMVANLYAQMGKTEAVLGSHSDWQERFEEETRAANQAHIEVHARIEERLEGLYGGDEHNK